MADGQGSRREGSRPTGLSLGTTVAGVVGLIGIWGGGFGCVGAIQNHLDGDFVPGAPLIQLVLSLGVIGFGLSFLFVSYGLDRGRPWTRHLILLAWMLLLVSLAFGPFGPLAAGSQDPFQRRLVLGVAGVTLLVTAYLYTKPNVVAYYQRRSQVPLR